MWWLLTIALASDGVDIDTTSVEHFAQAIEASQNGVSLRKALRQYYFADESPAQRTFLRYAGAHSPRRLARCVERFPELYSQLDQRLDDVRQAQSNVDDAVRTLQTSVPTVSPPTVYVHVGCFNSGGTATDHGLHIGIEHMTRPDPLPERFVDTWFDVALHPPELFTPMVVHELAHFEQPDDSPTLLHHALVEGSADFIAQLLTGHVVTRNHAYGLAHEQDIWEAFVQDMHNKPLSGTWFYKATGSDWPRDLGYFVGFRIAEAYYAQSEDKDAALVELLALTDVQSIFIDSGYAPEFDGL